MLLVTCPLSVLGGCFARACRDRFWTGFGRGKAYTSIGSSAKCVVPGCRIKVPRRLCHPLMRAILQVPNGVTNLTEQGEPACNGSSLPAVIWKIEKHRSDATLLSHAGVGRGTHIAVEDVRFHWHDTSTTLRSREGVNLQVSLHPSWHFAFICRDWEQFPFLNSRSVLIVQVGQVMAG